MFQVQGASRNSCSLLAVLCGKAFEDDKNLDVDGNLRYPFPEIASCGRLEVQSLNSPSIEELRRTLDAFQPNFVYLQGEQRSSNEIVPFSWAGIELSNEEGVAGLFDATTPTTVYLEVPDGEKLAEAIQSKGIPYVIYWKSEFSCFEACHFRHALFSVVQSSSSHTWDAFHVAEASFRLYCVRNDQKIKGKLGPSLLGEPPKIDVPPPEIGAEDDEEGSSDDLPAIKIYDDDVNVRLLVCGEPSTLDDCSFDALEDGLNALLNIEIRGSKLHSRVSALAPPSQAATFSRGVVTMRCDISTASAAHISLLVSGSAQTCFDDQLMENHIKSEVIEKSQLVHSLPECEKDKMSHSHPRKSDSVACGATVFEVRMKVPLWASQVLRQLAPDLSYRSLVALGIAGVQGLAVASFGEHDAERLLSFCVRQGKDLNLSNCCSVDVPSWLKPPLPSINRFEMCKTSPGPYNDVASGVGSVVKSEDNGIGLQNGTSTHLTPSRNKLNIAAMRPIPHVRNQKMLPFSTAFEVDGHDGFQVKTGLPIIPSSKHGLVGSTPVTQRRLQAGSFHTKQIISLNPLPLKKHGCGRNPIHVCSEDEFLKDVMEFLILRGHNRLIPQGGLAEFPDAVLNAKRLDLFNLYREVVSRGGFHVGNGINWKGQVFSKMRNHTITNRMTGVGNTLKRHYETYLLEYELAHDDVDGECCLLCHSAAGDWVNCGICGEWAHFGCDRRQGLGAFKDYAKTDGLEYICPQCSMSNFKKKVQKTSSNGYS